MFVFHVSVTVCGGLVIFCVTQNLKTWRTDLGYASVRSPDIRPPPQTISYRAGWHAKMASIEVWIPWRNAHRPHWCELRRIRAPMEGSNFTSCTCSQKTSRLREWWSWDKEEEQRTNKRDVSPRGFISCRNLSRWCPWAKRLFYLSSVLLLCLMIINLSICLSFTNISCLHQ